MDCITPDSENVNYELVKFENVPISYDVTQNFEVEFSIDASVKGSSKDWIGIFRAGWNSFESFLEHEYALGLPCDETGRRRRVKFSSKYLQNAQPGVLYQFVYVNKYLEIMGVSRYFQFAINNHQKGISDDVCDVPCSQERESSPSEETNLLSENKICENNNPGSTLKKIIIPHQAESYSNCKLLSISKWTDSCTSCYKCRGIFQMKQCHDELVKKMKQYEDNNLALQSRVYHLEKCLESEENYEKNNMDAYILHFSEAVDSAIRSSVYAKADNKEELGNGDLDWDFSSKELYLKAVIGHQELTIRDLTKVICELGYIDRPKLCCHQSTSLHDTVKKVRAEEQAIAEICDINNNTSEEEF